MKKTALPCPCGSGRPLAQCCQPYLSGHASAPNAEALMRSRYSAYSLGAEDYLLRTWHPSTRPASLDLTQPPQPKWIGLNVIAHQQQDQEHATVHFVARYRVGGRAERLTELSRFVLEQGQWFYVDGDVA